MIENDEQKAKQVDRELIKIFFACLHRWWLIGVSTLLAAAIAFIYTANFITPLYRASVTIYVNNNRNRADAEYVTGSDLATAQSLVNTYISMLTSDTVLEQVNDSIGMDYSAAQLRSMITAEQVNDTELFQVFVTHPDPWMAASIANGVADTAPEVIADFVEGSSTKIIDFAKVPTARCSPSWRSNTLKGGIAGALLAILVIALISILDVRIKDEEELTDLLHLPILGQIPDVEQSEEHSSAYAYGKYERGSGKSATADDKSAAASGNNAPGKTEGTATPAAAVLLGSEKRQIISAEKAAVSAVMKPELKQKLLGNRMISGAQKENRGRQFNDNSIEQERLLVLGAKTSFYRREAYNMLRTNINFSLADVDACKTVLVTSAMQSEGKSITAVNLAISMAISQGRVLLIDCDLRRPKLSRLLQVHAPSGVSDVLVGYATARSSIIHYRKNLDVILAGRIPPNPSELLGSARMSELLEQLKDDYDYIILDTPPVGMVTDAVALAPNANGVLFVVRMGWSERNATLHGVEQLSYVATKIIGVVMTCVPMEKSSYGYKRYRYSRYGKYGYRHKYGYGKGYYGKGYGYGGKGYGYGYGYGYTSRQAPGDGKPPQQGNGLNK